MRKIMFAFYKATYHNVGKVLDVCVEYADMGGFINCTKAVVLGASVTGPVLLFVMWLFVKLMWLIF